MDIDPREALRAEIKKLPGGFAEAADALGCTSAWLYILCKKSKRAKSRKFPGLDFACRVAERFGIPVTAWSHHPAKRAA